MNDPKRKSSLQPYRNVPPYLTPTGGWPSQPSNAGLMRTMDPQEYYAAGYTEQVMRPVKIAAVLACRKVRLQKEAADIEAMLRRGDIIGVLKPFLSSDSVQKQASERLKGGLADGRSSQDFDQDELRRGIEVEMEHTNDEALAREIAKDHLAEVKDYYTRLERMEEQAEREGAPLESEATERQEKHAVAGPVHPSERQQAPAPAGAQPVQKPQPSPVTGAPIDPNKLFIQQLRQRAAPQQAQQQPAQPPAGAQSTEPVEPEQPAAPAPPVKTAVFTEDLKITAPGIKDSFSTKIQTPEPPKPPGPVKPPNTTELVSQNETTDQTGGEMSDAEQLPKTADAPAFLRRQHNILFTPDGKVIIRRSGNRRVELPEGALAERVPYEDPVRYIPKEGIPETGFHGYEIGLGSGDAAEVPEGFEAVPPVDVLRELYASMGLKSNQEWRDVDRQRARALLRLLRRRERQPIGA